jgi:hypothetical protein
MSITANCTSTSLLRAEIRDVGTNQLIVTASNSVTFSLDGQGSLVGINPSNAQGGIATLTLRSAASAGTATVTATAENMFPGTIAVTMQAGDAAKLICAVNPGTLIADGTTTSLVEAKVKDDYDNDVPNATNTITFQVNSCGTLIGTTVQAASGGKATITLKLTSSCTAVISAVSTGLASGTASVYPSSWVIEVTAPQTVPYYKAQWQNTTERCNFSVYATIKDRPGGTKVSGANCQVSLQILSNIQSVVDEFQVSASSGLASFEDIMLPEVGKYTLRIASPNLEGVDKEIYVYMYAYGGQENHVTGQVNSGMVDLHVPVGCLEQAVAVVINPYEQLSQNKKNTITAADSDAKSGNAAYCIYNFTRGSLFEFSAMDEFLNPTDVTFKTDTGGAMLSMSYPDANGDGIVDGIGIDASELRIFLLDEENEKWVLPEVESKSRGLGYAYQSVNKQGKRVEYWGVKHLSIYCLMGGVSSGELNIERLMSYPNPFSDECTISFTTGADADLKVGIYTVSGRLIKILKDREASLYGYQEAYWDGLDSDGKEAANGIYIYHVIAKSASKEVRSSGKTVKMK